METEIREGRRGRRVETHMTRVSMVELLIVRRRLALNMSLVDGLRISLLFEACQFLSGGGARNV